jgi:dolichyl-diphosphooligosaccharide--protein glycosyltransferase
LWIAAALLAFRARRIAPLLAAALALGAVAVPLSALQTRFGPHLAVVSALLAGWLVARASRPLGARVAVGIVAVTLAWGVRPATLPTSAVHPYVLGGFDALVWLRRAAPPTSHFREPWRRPEYAVAAEWVWGHWITQIGQKPNVANPLGQTPENRQGVEDVARLFLAESDDDATAAAGRLGVRYLLLSSIPVTLRELAVQAGRDPERYVVKGADGSDTFLGPFFDTFHARLYLGRGAGEEGTEPVPGVRLVFESRVRIDFMGPRPAVRIFEVVPGAVLRGRCSSGSVEGRAELEETGLTYRVLAAPGPDGAYALRIPYASERTGASIPARVTVRCGDGVTAVPVAERDVIEGGDVAVQAEGDAPDGAGPTSGPSSPMPPGEGRRGVSSPGSMEAP